MSRRVIAALTVPNHMEVTDVALWLSGLRDQQVALDPTVWEPHDFGDDLMVPEEGTPQNDLDLLDKVRNSTDRFGRIKTFPPPPPDCGNPGPNCEEHNGRCD